MVVGGDAMVSDSADVLNFGLVHQIVRGSKVSTYWMSISRKWSLPATSNLF